jgi:hypothetical protein
MTIPFYHGHYTETLHVSWSHFHKGSENTAGYSHTCFLAALWRGRPEVHPLILTKPAKNSSSFLTITGKSHVQRQVAAFFCEGIIYPEQEYSQQTYLLYWLLDGEMGLPGCTSQNEIGRSFKACGKTHIRHVASTGIACALKRKPLRRPSSEQSIQKGKTDIAIDSTPRIHYQEFNASCLY